MRTTLNPNLTTLAVVFLGAVLTAQIEMPDPLAGTYTVDPKGTGKRDFRDLQTAVRYLSLVGVAGDFELAVKPGSYEGALVFYPVPGLEEGKRIVIRATGQGDVRVSGDGTLISFNEGCKDFVLDGLVFGESQGPAIFAGGGCTDIEIRNCRFGEAVGANKLIEIQGKNTTRRWNIHHNTFEMGGGRSYGIYTQGTYELDIHHNEFVCRDAREPISIWNSNKSESRVHDNVFRGTLSTCCMRLDVSGHDVDVCNNLFLLELGNNNEALIRSQGLRNGAYNKIRHNVFVVRGSGAAVRTRGPIALDHNLYAMQEGGVGMTNNAVHATLKDWQDALQSFAVDEQADKNSAMANPKFFARHAQLLALFHRFDENDEGGGEAAEPDAKPKPPNPDAATEAAKAAARAEIHYLIGLLKEDDPVVLRLAMRGLVRHGPRAAPAVPGLGRLCAHAHAAVRADAADALGQIRIGAEIVIPELSKLLNDKDERVLLATLNTLGSFAHLAVESAPQLQALEKHELESVAQTAKQARRAILGRDTDKDSKRK